MANDIYILTYTIPYHPTYKNHGATCNVYCTEYDACTSGGRVAIDNGVSSITINQLHVDFDIMDKYYIYILRALQNDMFAINMIDLVYCGSKKSARRIAAHRYDYIPRKWNKHDKIRDYDYYDTYLHIIKHPLFHVTELSSISKYVADSLERIV